MGSASVVVSGIVFALVIIIVYLLMGAALSSFETMADAQSDLTLHQESRIRTSVDILNSTVDEPLKIVYVNLKNTGNEIIGDFSYMEVYLIYDSSPVYYPYGNGVNQWDIVQISPDYVHPMQLDPGEVMNISVRYDQADQPRWLQVTTSNGVFDSAYVGV